MKVTATGSASQFVLLIIARDALLKVIKIFERSHLLKEKKVCSLKDFDRLLSGNIGNTLGKQGIADASEIAPGGANKILRGDALWYLRLR